MSINKAYIKYLVKNATGSNTVDKNKKTDHIEDEINKGKYILASKRYDARQSAADKAKGRRVYSRILHTLIGAVAGGAVRSALPNSEASKHDIISAAAIGSALGYGTSFIKDRALGIDPGNIV